MDAIHADKHRRLTIEPCAYTSMIGGLDTVTGKKGTKNNQRCIVVNGMVVAITMKRDAQLLIILSSSSLRLKQP